MPTQEERLSGLEFDLKQFRTETLRVYTDLVYEVTILKGLGEDSIKRLAALSRDVGEIKTTQQEHTAMLALILQRLDDLKPKW